ncbi:MAG TPA: MlaD family protein [Kofleriaceae bacterium]|jgi:phospholipid/cholesterol/gamma-HCH transport system substrate-binding protein
MTTKAQRIRVAVFTLVGAALVTVVIAVFAGLHLRGSRAHYWMDFDRTVYGLQPGGDVYYQGVRVGAVTSLHAEPDHPGHVHVEIAVERTTPVRANTHAFLIFAGITGIKEIDLRDSTAEAQPLPPGSRIQVGAGVLDALSRDAEHMANQSTLLIDHMTQTAANLEQLTSANQLGAAVDETRAAAASLASTGDELRATVHEDRAALHASLQSLDRAATGANQLATELQQVVRSNSEQVHATIGELHEAARSLAELARELRQSPSRLIYSHSPPDRKLPR